MAFQPMAALQFMAHPWHGISTGPNVPEQVTAFIEVVPSDTVKYEVDKQTGFLKVDRPQKFSSLVPALYGFIPRTYCKEQVAAFAMEKTGRENIVGDGDPMDICVLTERNITQGNILINAIPIGGFRMLDGGDADDKIIAIMREDEVYKDWRDISDCPESLVQRLQHYFLTYKEMPGHEKQVEITHVYGRDEAHEVIRRSIADYKEHFT